MKVTGQHTFDAPREVVWAALLNPDIIADTLPGCERLEEVGENEYKGVFRIQVGPVSGEFEGKFALSNLNPPESYHMRVNGSGVTGFMDGEGDIRLEDAADSTNLHYEMNFNVGGRVAGIGGRLIESAARLITRQGLERFHRRVKEYQAQGRA